MPSGYPGVLPDTPLTHQDVQDDVLAIATELGTDPSGAFATVKARLDAVGGAGAVTNPGLRSGKYYSGQHHSIGGIGVASGELFCIPFYLGAAATIDRIGVEVTTGTTSGLARFGVYSDTGSGFPGALLLDAGTAALTGGGPQQVTISQALSAGLVWLAILGEGATASTCRSLSGQSWPVLHQEFGNTTFNGYKATAVTVGALPATFPVGASPDGSSPKIFVRGL